MIIVALSSTLDLTMKNPNLVSLLFASVVVSLLSILSICHADGSKKPVVHRDMGWLGPWNRGAALLKTFDDRSRKILKRRLRISDKCKCCDKSRDTGKVPHFSYVDGSPNGPNKWGSLNSDWKTCESGNLQSPININVKQAQVSQCDLKKAYRHAHARLVNGGHNIAVEWEGDAGGIELNGTAYNLVQCHWHTPSEHTIDEKRFDAELHLVHSNEKEGKAVIAILYTIGKPDPFVGNLTGKMKVAGPKGIDLGRISASSIKCRSRRYFRYIGSLTTPGCDEGVIWTVASKVRSVSEDQIKLLKGVLDHEFQDNARPLQDLQGRPVWQFESPEEKE